MGLREALGAAIRPCTSPHTPMPRSDCQAHAPTGHHGAGLGPGPISSPVSLPRPACPSGLCDQSGRIWGIKDSIQVAFTEHTAMFGTMTPSSHRVGQQTRSFRTRCVFSLWRAHEDGGWRFPASEGAPAWGSARAHGPLPDRRRHSTCPHSAAWRKSPPIKT